MRGVRFVPPHGLKPTVNWARTSPVGTAPSAALNGATMQPATRTAPGVGVVPGSVSMTGRAGSAKAVQLAGLLMSVLYGTVSLSWVDPVGRGHGLSTVRVGWGCAGGLCENVQSVPTPGLIVAMAARAKPRFTQGTGSPATTISVSSPLSLPVSHTSCSLDPSSVDVWIHALSGGMTLAP